METKATTASDGNVSAAVEYIPTMNEGAVWTLADVRRVESALGADGVQKDASSAPVTRPSGPHE